MTPAARVAAAIDILDRIATGIAPEPTLATWARNSRYAGSKDRAAVRDLVFDGLRQWRSARALGGGAPDNPDESYSGAGHLRGRDGRAVMLGLARAGGQVETLFSGEGHAPAPPSEEEAPRVPVGAEAWDLPDWLMPRLERALGADLPAFAEALQHRAPLWLRVNPIRATRDEAQASLAEEGIETQPHPDVPTALEVTSSPRRVARSAAYLNGLVELQDLSPQMACAAIDVSGKLVLDYCAGGGGKALALASQGAERVHAHDAHPARMVDLPPRAERAGVAIRIVDAPRDLYDVVLADVPCSGSGSWRRDPVGKWRLTPDRLDELCALQAKILDDAAALVRPGGQLVYMTCSVLDEENRHQIEQFIDRTPGWHAGALRTLTPMAQSDGFFYATINKYQP